MMNKIIIALITALVSVSSYAADKGVVNEVLFNKNEVGVVLNGSYSKDPQNDWGADAGLRAFPLNKYVGVEATAGFRDLDSGPALDDTRFQGIVRLPLDKYRVSLEVVGGARWDFDEQDYQWSVGPRLAYRLNSKVELFGGYRYNFARQSLAVTREFPFGLSFNF